MKARNELFNIFEQVKRLTVNVHGLEIFTQGLTQKVSTGAGVFPNLEVLTTKIRSSRAAHLDILKLAGRDDGFLQNMLICFKFKKAKYFKEFLHCKRAGDYEIIFNIDLYGR